MASLRVLLLLFMIPAAFATAGKQLKRSDLKIAITEMESASYYTFVTLLQMVQGRIPVNATFLMPSDRTLALTPLHQNRITEFILSHTIPWPLTVSHLRYFPTGSMVPTYRPGHRLRVSHYHKKVYLNNVAIVHPNVCTAGVTVRCHGISGVLVSTAGSTPPLPHPQPSTRPPPPPPPAAAKETHPTGPNATAPPPPVATSKVIAPSLASPPPSTTQVRQAPPPTGSKSTLPKSKASNAPLNRMVVHTSTVFVAFASIMLFEVY